MATGKKVNNGVTGVGTSFMDLFGIGIADAENLKVCNVYSANNNQVVLTWYNGAGAITLANYNGFPTGSIIVDMQAHKTHEKTGATTWVSSVARA